MRIIFLASENHGERMIPMLNVLVSRVTRMFNILTLGSVTCYGNKKKKYKMTLLQNKFQ